MNQTRRDFLKTTAAATLAMSSLRIVGADSPTKKYRTALLGCGWWGKNILREAMASGRVKIVGPLSVYGNVRNILDDQYIVSRRPYGARPNAPRWIQVGAKLAF